MQSSMSTTASEATESLLVMPEEVDATSRGKAARGAPRMASKVRKERLIRPRAPARPHRKLTDDILMSRIADLEKKLSVLRSRTVLIDDRLDAYKREHSVRVESGDV
jgi:hypothetical protein